MDKVCTQDVVALPDLALGKCETDEVLATFYLLSHWLDHLCSTFHSMYTNTPVPAVPAPKKRQRVEAEAEAEPAIVEQKEAKSAVVAAEEEPAANNTGERSRSPSPASQRSMSELI